MQILLLAPQANEFDHLLDGLRSEGCTVNKAELGSIEGARTRELDIIIATGGHGKAQFAAQTQYLISRLSPPPDVVVCAGASGALTDHLSPGDVVVGSRTIEHDYKLRFAEDPPPVHAGHSSSIEQLQETARNFHFPFEIHFGIIASGDEDIVDRKRAVELHEKTDALCVAWEGSGGARAAALSNLPFLEIRGVTDTANDSASGDFQKNLEITIPNIASLLVHWLRDSSTG